MTSPMRDPREKMVRYYGFYSSVSRGLRQKENQDALIPCVLDLDENKKPKPESGSLDSKNT